MDRISNFQPLRILNTEWKILTKVFTCQLQAVLDCLIFLEHTCAAKIMTNQDNLHLVHMLIKKVNNKSALINSDQSKGFNRFTIFGGCLVSSWIQAVLSHLDLPPVELWSEVHGVKSKPFMLPKSFNQGCSLLPMQKRFVCKLRANPVLCEITLAGATTSVKYPVYANNVRRSGWFCEKFVLSLAPLIVRISCANQNQHHDRFFNAHIRQGSNTITISNNKKKNVTIYTIYVKIVVSCIRLVQK